MAEAVGSAGGTGIGAAMSVFSRWLWPILVCLGTAGLPAQELKPWAPDLGSHLGIGYSHSGKILASVTAGKLRLLDQASGGVLKEIPLPNAFQREAVHLAFSYDDSEILLENANTLYAANLSSGEVERRFDLREAFMDDGYSATRGVAYNRDGNISVLTVEKEPPPLSGAAYVVRELRDFEGKLTPILAKDRTFDRFRHIVKGSAFNRAGWPSYTLSDRAENCVMYEPGYDRREPVIYRAPYRWEIKSRDDDQILQFFKLVSRAAEKEQPTLHRPATALTDDARLVAIAFTSGHFFIFAYGKNKPLVTLRLQPNLAELAIAPDGSHVAMLDANRKLHCLATGLMNGRAGK